LAQVSLPKHEVYEEYLGYCATNNVKPLSTADFGKVMKQVYPQVSTRYFTSCTNSQNCEEVSLPCGVVIFRVADPDPAFPKVLGSDPGPISAQVLRFKVPLFAEKYFNSLGCYRS
jgi:hypothetical protein